MPLTREKMFHLVHTKKKANYNRNNLSLNRYSVKKVALGNVKLYNPRGGLAVFIKIMMHTSFSTEIPLLEFIPQIHTSVPTTAKDWT